MALILILAKVAATPLNAIFLLQAGIRERVKGKERVSAESLSSDEGYNNFLGSPLNRIRILLMPHW